MVPTLQRLVPPDLRDNSARDGLGFTQRLLDIRAINTAPIDRGTMRPGTPGKTLLTVAVSAWLIGGMLRSSRARVCASCPRFRDSVSATDTVVQTMMTPARRRHAMGSGVRKAGMTMRPWRMLATDAVVAALRLTVTQA